MFVLRRELDPNAAPTVPAGDSGLLAPLPYQRNLLRIARHGDRPEAGLEQVVVRAPDPAPPAPKLERALQALAQRHDGLRLAATEDAAGEPILIAQRRIVPVLAIRDWSALAPAAQDRALEQWLNADRAAGFDLAAGPGWRLLLADLGLQGHVCVLSVHHALMDAPAMAAALEDLYDLIAGRPLPHAAPGALHEAQAALRALPAEAPALAAALLDGAAAPSLLAQPAASGPAQPQTLSRRLEAELAARLRARARAPGAAGSFATFQAAWALVLARWTGEGDVTFGLTLSGRNRLAGHERTVGCLIATLPQRARIAPEADFDALAADLRARTETLRRLHGAPPERLSDWAGIAPDQPLFDTVLVFARQSLGAALAARGKGWERRQVRLIECGEAGLTMAIYDDPEIRLELEFDPARLPPARAERLLSHLERLLIALADSPVGVRLADLPMLSPSEVARLARLGRPDRPAIPAPEDLAAALSMRAAEDPDAPALILPGSGRLSRAELDRRANGLAQAIAAAVPPGGRVALNLPRGLDQSVALLACLKAGRAFVPLDPAQPAELRAQMVCDARAAAVLGGAPLPLAEGAAVAQLSPEAAPAPHPPAGEPAGPDACAYVLFTSGTTGRPKGVMGRHGALAAHAAAVIDAYRLTPADRVLAMAAPAFDVALEEQLPTLLAGAAVVLAPPTALESVPALLDLVAAEGVSVLNLPASLWHLMTEEMDRRNLRLPGSVRLVVTGSERVSPAALAIWRRLAPEVRWINAYGPTEATITALVHAVEPGDPPTDPGAEVPVGRPLAHARVVLTAPDGSPAPEGAPGEIRIGGAALTLGYLDRPAETATAFGPLPQGAPEGGWPARFYATGDRGAWGEDGALRFLGRRDRQVKLRGHRIDLTGIERVLGALPGVHAVHVAPDAAGERLVAWLAGPAAAGGAEGLDRLRTQAARRLHGPSLPVLVAVPDLPLRPNGKIDTARLPAPPAGVAAGPPGAGSGPEPDALTAEIAALFASILGLDRIDPDADFRDLGGHSLVALRLAGAVETRFGRRTRTTDLYRHPTARQLARHLAAPAGGARYIVPIQPQGTGVPFFAVHVLGEKEALYRPLAAALGPDIPVYGITAGPPEDPEKVRIEDVAQAYFADLMQHHPTGPLALGAVSMAAYFAYDLAQRLIAAGREVRVLAILDADGPGGRPALRGWARIAAHLAEFRRHGWQHLRAVRAARRERRRFAREAAKGLGGEVTGTKLVLANMRAVEAYRPQPYPGRILVLRAADSYWDSPEALDSALGWRPVARGPIERIDVPGDHLSILAPPNVARIARALEPLLRPG